MTAPETTHPNLEAAPGRSLDWFFALLLMLITAFLYGQMGEHEFINLDDVQYVSHNAEVQEGLSMDGLRWAFGTYHAANWHPLTWLSHMLDVSLFGLDAGAHHRTNACLHVLAALLAFCVFRGLLRAGNRALEFAPRSIALVAFFAAASFAWHPLRVESVAWVSERKDLLAALFWFLSILAYLRYVRAPSLLRYLPIPLFLFLSLASKPMAVTLPCLLLLFDVWPLRRSWSSSLLLEKLPLFALAVASSAVTMAAQRDGGAFDELEGLGLSQRIAGALGAQAIYLRQMFWPGELGYFYPHPGVLQPAGYDAWNAAAWGGLCLFLALSTASILWRKRLPWLALGWAWYLGMLVPVIGLVQVGGQAHADRYTYLPSLGISLALCASVASLLRVSPMASRAAAAAGAVFLLWIVPQTRAQVATWKTSRSASQQALVAADQNFLAHNQLGNALEAAGDFDAAFHQYLEVLKLRPNWVPTQLNVAHTLIGQGKLKAAERALRKILEDHPEFQAAGSDLGVLLSQLNRGVEALPYLKAAWNNTAEPMQVRIKAGPGLAWVLATVYPTSMRDGPQAIKIIQACMELETNWLSWNTLAAAMGQCGRFSEAALAQKKAIELAEAEDPHFLQYAADMNQRLAAYESNRNPN